MAPAKCGKRHTLLFFRRTLDRMWTSSFTIGLLLGAVWAWGRFFSLPLVVIQDDFWLLLGAALALVIAGYAFLARHLAYVQACNTHLVIVTPFLRLNVSYRRFQAVRTVLMQQLFSKSEASWSQRAYLEPFYGKTAIVIDLSGYPLKPALLRLFWPDLMLSRRSPGLVLLVPDWMRFSTELDTYQGVWLQAQGKQAKTRYPER